MAGPGAVDLATLLDHPRQGSFDAWLDLLSPTCRDAVTLLGLDVHRAHGRPWFFHGSEPVRIRHLPDEKAHRYSALAARALEVVRAWAVRQGGSALPLDYEVPWRFAVAVLRDQEQVARYGLAHLVALANHEGEWLGDWVAEYVDTPAVRAVVAGDVAVARELGIRVAPAFVVGGQRLEGGDVVDLTASLEEALLRRRGAR